MRSRTRGDRPALRRWCSRLLGGLFLGGLAIPFGPAVPAAAHAAIVDTSPRQRAVLGSAPGAVTVTFSEPVTPVPGKARVLAPDGKRIDDGEAEVRGATLRIPVRPAEHPLGTYLVSYRVVSADSHPVAGGYTFSVGAPSAGTPRAVPDDGADASVRIAVPVARYLGYAGLVLLIGPALLLGALWPRRLSRRGPIRLVRLGVGLSVAATLAGLWLQAPYRSGSSALDVSASELRQVLGTQFGVVLLVRLAVLAAVAALLPPVLRGRAARWRVALLVPLGLAGLATWPLVGHAVAAPIPVASAVADITHLAAMAAWLGGLVTLVGFLLPRTHPRVLGVLLPVWSRWATVAVVWLVAGGLVQAVSEVGAVGPLVGTAYGRLVLVKAALLAAVLAAAAYARRMVRRRAGGAPADRRRLRRTVGAEVAGAALVLGLSAVLVQTTPARTAGLTAATAATDSFAETLSCPLYTLQFDIYPVQLGENNTVHAYLYTGDGRPLTAVEWTLTTALPDRGIEPVRTSLVGLEAHHAIGSVTFPVPGDWRLRFTIRTTDIDEATVSTTVRVR